jgi:glycosyltransferase involved in cell wall biosynthesis
MGRMMIATDIGGSRETIIDGQSGWLVKPNDVNQLAQAIKESINLELPQRLYRAKLARNHVERHFSVDAMKEKILRVYSSLVDGE